MEDEKITDEFSIEAKSLLSIFKEFQPDLTFTGLRPVFTALRFQTAGILLHSQRIIGRHNAVDKVIGYSVLENIGLAGKLMLASGRLSSEIASNAQDGASR